MTVIWVTISYIYWISVDSDCRALTKQIAFILSRTYAKRDRSS